MENTEYIELTEKYNMDGVCVQRYIEGYELPADKEPSVVILRDLEGDYFYQKHFVKPERIMDRFGIDINDLN